jgi:hypothetical protein
MSKLCPSVVQTLSNRFSVVFKKISTNCTQRVNSGTAREQIGNTREHEGGNLQKKNIFNPFHSKKKLLTVCQCLSLSTRVSS